MKTAFKKLKILQSVRLDPPHWETVRKLVSEISSCDVIEKEWCDRFKAEHPEMYSLDLSEMKTWSTYQDCVSLDFSIMDSKHLKCEAVVYDGDGCDGSRGAQRFKASLKVPMSFIGKIDDEICSRFNRLLNSLHDKHLRQQKKNWIAKCSKKLLDEK